MNAPDLSLRRLLKLMAFGAAVLPLGRALIAGAADALRHLSVDDSQAKALGYTEDAARIDPVREGTHKKGSKCQNCSLYQAAQAQGGYAPCGAFPGKSVNANGWCRAYTAKS